MRNAMRACLAQHRVDLAVERGHFSNAFLTLSPLSPAPHTAMTTILLPRIRVAAACRGTRAYYADTGLSVNLPTMNVYAAVSGYVVHRQFLYLPARLGLTFSFLQFHAAIPNPHH